MKQSPSILPNALSLLTLVGGVATAVPATAQHQKTIDTAEASNVTALAQTHQKLATSPDRSGQNLVSARKINETTIELLNNQQQRITLDFYGNGIFRLYLDPAGRAPHNPEATPAADILVENPRRGVKSLDLKGDANYFTVTTPQVTLVFDRATGGFVVKKASGEEVFQSLTAPTFDKDGTHLTLANHEGEYFYGGGVQNGRFSHRGQVIAIENTNNWVDGGVASPTPFYWSTKGYGMMWHTFKPGLYDFGNTQGNLVKLRHAEQYLDVFFMVAERPEALLSSFYQLTGNPVLLPKFGFYQGHLNAYNRDYWTEAKDNRGFMKMEDGKTYNESQKDNGGIKESLNGERNNYQFSARAAIDRYLNNDMPLGWFLPNDGYGAGYGQTKTLDGNIENLRQFGDYARSKGVEIGLWTQSDLHPKDSIEALLQRDIVKEVGTAGVRVLKTDVAWVGWGYSFGLNGVADVGRIMPKYGNNARPFIISLDGWAGTQRYAGIWSGDQTGGDWEYIRFHIPTFIGSGLSGQPNITSDLDGIFGGKNIPVNVREFQWKTFTPMELNMDGWGSNPKYPHALGGKSIALNRWYLKLKSELLPYTYTAAAEAVNGKPMIRPMFMEESNAFTLGKRTQYQFMYGDAFLVAPIYQNTAADEQGNDRRDGIYLPKGNWVDYFTGDLYAGGRIINHFDAPLWKLPVLVKADAIIPMANPNNTPAEIKKDLRIFEIYAERGTKAGLYDDDGKTQAYLEGKRAFTELKTTVKKQVLTLDIDRTMAQFPEFVKSQQTELRINVSKAPKKLTATVGDAKVKLTQVSTREEFEQGTNVWFYDAKPNLNRWVRAGEESVGEVIKNPQVLVKLAATDVTENAVSVTVKGFEFKTPNRLLVHHGKLAAPQFNKQQSKAQAYTLQPAWDAVENADYYEVEHEGQIYSTICALNHLFDDLAPVTNYSFRVRAVNADGASAWTDFQLSTVKDPLEWAVKGVKATTSVQNQGGQGTDKLFDRDLKTIWHTSWSNQQATPFEMIVDLRSVNQLERMEYIPREDAGNGTILSGSYALSTDRQNWSAPVAFNWEKDATTKTVKFNETTAARYVKLNVDKAVGNFGSGREMYVYRRPGTEGMMQGDINRDKRVDENDLTSYMNYTGLRRGDGDFDYVAIGDINNNGLIDAYDISCVGVELDGGVRNSSDKVRGQLVLTPNVKTYKAGDVVEIKVSGKDLHYVNALSFGLPYKADELEYKGITLKGMKDMVNLTYDRLHTSGQKALYPTFVNRGNNFLLEEGNPELFTIKFVAKKAGKFNLKAVDGLLIDRNLGTASF